MVAKTTAITVRRNTAVSTGKTLEQPAQAMMSEQVPEGTYLFGFDPHDPRNEPLVFAADSNATREPNQHYAEPFMLHTWAVKRIELADPDSGETSPHARLILLQQDGETLSFVSSGALGSLDLIRSLRGDGPYDPPIPIVVTESKTRGGFRVFKLRIVTPREPSKPTK